MSEPKIACILERRYLRQEMPGAVIRALQAQGAQVDVLCTAAGRFDPGRGVFYAENRAEANLDRYDLIIARGRDALCLSMLAYAEAAGLRAINTYTATEAVRNKAHLAIALGRAGILSAPTVFASEAATLCALSDEWFPLILKATYGDNSQGLRLVRQRDDLEDLHWGDALVLAQQYLPNSGFDLKLYVCGDRVFAVKKPSPFNGHAAPAQPVQLKKHMLDLALRCGRTFGLEVYGVDTRETPNGLVVIEVNEFPNFTGVPDAARSIVEHILERQTGGRSDRRKATPLENTNDTDSSTG
jgi:ribosomal protein S6--L-glutamate ligase